MELVGVLLAVNKLATLGAASDAVPARGGFTAVDRALVDAVAALLAPALKVVVRQTVLRTAQEEHIASIVAISSIFAGMRPPRCPLVGTAYMCIVAFHALLLKPLAQLCALVILLL